VKIDIAILIKIFSIHVGNEHMVCDTCMMWQYYLIQVQWHVIIHSMDVVWDQCSWIRFAALGKKST